MGISNSTINKYKELFRSETVCFLIGLILLLFTIYLLIAVISFFFTGAADQGLLEALRTHGESVKAAQFENYVGQQGAVVSDFLVNKCFGVGSFLIILCIAVIGLRLMGIRKFCVWKWLIGCSLLAIWTSIFMALITNNHADSFIYWGGLYGYNVSTWLTDQVGYPGVWLILIFTAICFLIYASAQTIIWIRSLLSLKMLRRSNDTDESPAITTDTDEDSFSDIEEEEDNEPVAAKQASTKIKLLDDEDDVFSDTEETEQEEPAGKQIQLEYGNTVATTNSPTSSIPPVEGAEDEDEDGDNYHSEEREPFNPTLDLENYKFPTIDLMKYYDTEPTIDKEEQEANKNRIIKTLGSFGIGISTIRATVGPTVTLYEITPQQGVRISKIRGLESDLALSLSAVGIRIIAPIPGKGTIGIEVPNLKPKIVSGQSIIGSQKFKDSTYELPIALGKTITNDVFMVDLCKMPHVLVAGATGQGKSVGLNTIIASLLYKKHPAELKFVLVDPKMVEFSIYSVIENHYLAELPEGGMPIITDVKKVVQTLQSLCVEMDNRYTLLMKAHVRNIKEYNAKFINRRLNPEKGHKYLPYIVVVIDEYGDLIMTAGKDIELPIARIAQKARAVGIHMIIATQRPTTNIITGTIKANFPARIAFRVTTSIDSRTILDRTGANQLIGKGDMLFLQGADPVRVQCAFIDTPEIERITQFIAEQQGYPVPYYLPEYVDENGGGSEPGEVDTDKLDPLFEKAAHLLVSIQQGSTSKIQREFSIGYNRAGRIMDQLEKAGIVGPSEGSKAREVIFKDSLMLDEFLKNYL
jgi:S-DNA-T family DNA segregation ATPase FtsK/SpoIIIE